MSHFSPIINAIEELKEDELPRNIATKLDQIIVLLNSDCDPHLCKSRALNALELVSEETGIQAYLRTQIYNILSRLESH